MEKKKKLAVFFPGTGYHTDKPSVIFDREWKSLSGNWKCGGGYWHSKRNHGSHREVFGVIKNVIFF